MEGIIKGNIIEAAEILFVLYTAMFSDKLTKTHFLNKSEVFFLVKINKVIVVKKRTITSYFYHPCRFYIHIFIQHLFIMKFKFPEICQ